MNVRRLHPSTWACVCAYALLTLTIVLEKFGETTTDTRLDLTDDPGGFLRNAFSLWNPGVSLGELQNQAYGYFFPQGSFFALADLAQVPGWVTERVWSALVLVVACEGMRRVAKALGQQPWAAAAAGLFYGLSPRMISELGVRSAEILPTAVIPWVLLPVVHVCTGRLSPRHGALFSAAAFACAGGVNATATVAPLPVVLIFVIWAVRRGRARWTFPVWWAGLIGAVSLWWVGALLWLGRYSPPFYDYVEDAPTTTQTSGLAPALRGSNNWVNYIVVDDKPWWPAGYDVSYSPWIVLGSGLLAVAGLVGLAVYRGQFRLPLLLSTGLGLVCLTLAHTGSLGSPIAGWVQDLLDGPLVPLRNIHKADPILRIPLAVGVGVITTVAAEALARRRRVHRAIGAGLALLLAGSLTALAWPAATGNLRTPGWTDLPDHWRETAAFLDAQDDGGAAWVVPGTGFAIQDWGWSMEEPLQVLGSSPRVTRSQVPLTPPASIRMMSSLESLIETGAGSPRLGAILDRIGVTYVVVRHDLDESVADAPLSSLTSIALARSKGITRVAQFGKLEFGPAIEVFRLDDGDGAEFVVRDTDDVVTVASGVEDAMTAVGAGLVGSDQAVVVRGDTGWDRPADVVGDGYRLRERNFGRVHDAESAVMSPEDHFTIGRVVANYPGADGAKPVVARYDGLGRITASTSSGYAQVIGPVRPETGPFAALDTDPRTRWQSAYLTKPTNQWLRLDLGGPRRVGRIEIDSPPGDLSATAVRTWVVSGGGTTVTVHADPETGTAVADLGGVSTDSVRLEVSAVVDRTSRAPVSVSGIRMAGFDFARTMVVPDVPAADDVDYVFESRAETRACITTLLAPDCSPYRARLSEESTGIDRTFDVPAQGTWRFEGLAVARARHGTEILLRPLGGVTARGSSWFGDEPAVNPRMAYDGDPTTSWLADPRDRTPTLSLDLGKRVKVTRIGVAPPATPGLAPTHAVLRAGNQTREVDLRGFGVFATLRARHIEITFSRPQDTSGAPLGMADLFLSPGEAKNPIDGSLRTGAVCGLGPNIDVDGTLHPTRVDGFLGDVISDGALAIHPCDGPLQLTAGEHRIRILSTEQFQPVSASLLTERAVSPSVASPSRGVTVTSSSRTRRVLKVTDGEEAILSTPQNFNDGWEATVGDRPLKPIQVDGWAQGWVLPEGTSGEVIVSFAPQRLYLAGVIGGLVLMAVVLGCAVVAGFRTRLGAPVVETDAGHMVLNPWLFAVFAAAAGWVLVGPVFAAAALVGTLLARWSRALTWLAVAVLLTGAGWAAQAVWETARYPQDRPDQVFAAGLALLLAASCLTHGGSRESR